MQGWSIYVVQTWFTGHLLPMPLFSLRSLCPCPHHILFWSCCESRHSDFTAPRAKYKPQASSIAFSLGTLCLDLTRMGNHSQHAFILTAKPSPHFPAAPDAQTPRTSSNPGLFIHLVPQPPCKFYEFMGILQANSFLPKLSRVDFCYLPTKNSN